VGSDDFNNELLFSLTQTLCYKIKFKQICDSGVWYKIDVNPMLGCMLDPKHPENWLEQIGINSLFPYNKSIKIISEFWITESALAHLKLLGAVDFDQEDVSTSMAKTVRLAP